MTIIDQSRLPKNALKEADNIYLYEDGQPGIRPGMDWFGVALPNGQPIQGFDYFVDSSGANHIVAVGGGVVYRTINDAATWTECTGATLDTTARVKFNQNRNKLYITNGVNNIVLYDGTTSLQTYVALTTPAAPSVAETGLTGTANSYWYKISRVNEIGFSSASPASVQVQADLDRANWDASNKVTLTMPAFEPTQTRVDVFVSEDNSAFYYIGSTSTTTFVDDGTYVIVPSNTAPTGNTTQGPRVGELVNVGARQYGTRDADNKHRIWFTGGGTLSGSFSTAYDGGYLDWQLGGKYYPTHVEDYRDGKSTPYATVWCDSPDGQGCLVQMQIEELTIANVKVNVPSAYQLPGSRGTSAPNSVVNVLNDYMFANSQAIYNLGSRAQFLNLLSTDEASSNIRPTIKKINPAAESKITAIYYDARVLFSYPSGSTENNYTAVFDTERKAWLPRAFTVGFSQFLKYTDNTTNKNKYLLASKPGDNRISKIDYTISGDYGQPFMTSLITSLQPVDKNRFEFQWTEEGEVEFSNPQGTIFIELLGIERNKGYKATNSQTITPQTTNVGWDTFAWDITSWDDTSVVPETYSESSVKRYFNVQRELNAVQWRITTNSLDAKYILRALQTHGTATFAGKPRAWRMT